MSLKPFKKIILKDNLSCFINKIFKGNPPPRKPRINLKVIIYHPLPPLSPQGRGLRYQETLENIKTPGNI